ncbi:MAG TPA: PadR family transcriptional regulator [Arenibaculum sp.]|nr:PadR family transcriptional regulator [Arenibaculum sp.]
MDAKTLCLGVLSRGSATGYEIRKQFEEGLFANFYDAGYGTIYPALKRLSAEGLIVGVNQPQETRPDRKVYTITPAGRTSLFSALRGEPAPDRVRSDLTFILFFGEHLPADHLSRLIDERIALYRSHLERMAQCRSGTPGEQFVRGFGASIYRAAADYLENRRHELIGAALPEASAAE